MLAIGIRAVYLSSTQDESDARQLYQELHRREPGYETDNDIKLLYLTPEKFNKSDSMQRLLAALCDKGLLSRFVIGNERCVSETFDFHFTMGSIPYGK